MRAYRIERPATAFSLTSGKQKNPRQHDRSHLDFIRSLPCAVCGSYIRVHAAHIRSPSRLHAKPGTGMSEKPDDSWTLPLCAAHHTDGEDAQHKGSELAFWDRHRLDPFNLATAIFRVSGNEERAHVILSEFRAEARKASLLHDRTELEAT